MTNLLKNCWGRIAAKTPRGIEKPLIISVAAKLSSGVAGFFLASHHGLKILG
ncbi:MAG: hypothetical protein ACI845_002351 [Gammaproteobacteria bacterium]|jgi:hypothetical protein